MGLRVLVAGAGAVGSVVGGLLAAAGHDVTLLGRRVHLAAIASDGLALEGLWGERRVRELTVAVVAAYRELFYGRLVPSTAHHRSSMLQDLERGRPTEIEAINGCIWRYGCEAGIPTPVNATMTRLVRFRARIVGETSRA